MNEIITNKFVEVTRSDPTAATNVTKEEEEIVG
jgi:hypothetical protein